MLKSSELKEKGRAAMNANYGMALLISIVLSVVGGAATGASYGSNTGTTLANELKGMNLDPSVIAGVVITVLSVTLFVLITGLLIDILAFNPLVVGCQYFFIKNSEGAGEFGNLSRAFKPDWKNNAITMLLNDLFLFLWYCLFIVPGVIKSYSYRLVPYLLAENPDLKGTEAITLSRKMMNGNKWRAFCLDFSFIGWFLLSLITCGLVGVFYTMPYYNCSCAEFYKAVRDENNGIILE